MKGTRIHFTNSLKIKATGENLIKKYEVSIQPKKKRMRDKWDVNVAGLVALIAAVGETSNNIMWSPFFSFFLSFICPHDFDLSSLKHETPTNHFFSLLFFLVFVIFLVTIIHS